MPPCGIPVVILRSLDRAGIEVGTFTVNVLPYNQTFIHFTNVGGAFASTSESSSFV